MSVVQTARYIKADLTHNNNKFWHITLHDDHTVETQWGRVGDSGQSKVFPHGAAYQALSFFNRKRREKEAKGYRLQQTINERETDSRVLGKLELATVAQTEIQSASPQAARLVSYLTEKNVHNILSSTTMSYDASLGTFYTPLGMVNKSALLDARELLVAIGDHVSREDWDFETTVNSYLMLIPQDIGRKRRSPHHIFPNLEAVQKQNALLDALETSLLGIRVSPTTGRPVFNVKLELVADGREIDRIRRKFRETRQAIHESRHLDLKNVYLVEIGAMHQAFLQDGAKMPNIWELWHGTRTSNLLSILQSGFQIPPSNAPHCTGRMFGNGVYHSDQSTKSLNYAYGTWIGGTRDDNCFMFLNNVAMGRYYVPYYSFQHFSQHGYDSTFAEKGKSGVINNEMIVYRCSQVDPVFLCEFSPGGK